MGGCTGEADAQRGRQGIAPGTMYRAPTKPKGEPSPPTGEVVVKELHRAWQAGGAAPTAL